MFIQEITQLWYTMYINIETNVFSHYGKRQWIKVIRKETSYIHILISWKQLVSCIHKSNCNVATISFFAFVLQMVRGSENDTIITWQWNDNKTKSSFAKKTLFSFSINAALSTYKCDYILFYPLRWEKKIIYSKIILSPL